MAKNTKPALPAELAPLIGRPCTIELAGRTLEVRIFDWNALPAKRRDQFLGDLFGDCDIGEHYADLVGDTDGGVTWINTRCVPFGFAGVGMKEWKGDALHADGSYPQFEQLLLLEGDRVRSIEVSGSAVPEEDATPVGRLADLELRAADAAKPARLPAAARPATANGFDVAALAAASKRKPTASFEVDDDPPVKVPDARSGFLLELPTALAWIRPDADDDSSELMLVAFEGGAYRELGRLALPGRLQAAIIGPGRVYVCQGPGDDRPALTIIACDVSQPQRPTIAWRQELALATEDPTITGDAERLIVGDGDRLQVFAWAQPLRPLAQATVKLPEDVSMNRLALAGDRLAVSMSHSRGLIPFDLSGDQLRPGKPYNKDSGDEVVIDDRGLLCNYGRIGGVGKAVLFALRDGGLARLKQAKVPAFHGAQRQGDYVLLYRADTDRDEDIDYCSLVAVRTTADAFEPAKPIVFPVAVDELVLKDGFAHVLAARGGGDRKVGLFGFAL